MADTFQHGHYFNAVFSCIFSDVRKALVGVGMLSWDERMQYASLEKGMSIQWIMQMITVKWSPFKRYMYLFDNC